MREFYHDNRTVYTVFLVCSGVGSILGSLSVAAFGNVKRKGLLALGSLAVLGCGISGFAMARSLVVKVP